jgi:hypothetical protein
MQKIIEKIYLSDWFEYIHTPYVEVIIFFRNLKRLIDYAPIVWKHRNWDHGFVLRFQKKLYEDLYKGCFIEGHHRPNKTTMKRLKTIICLLGRLSEDNYGSMNATYLTRRFGEDEIYFNPIKGTENKPGGPYSRLISTREQRLSVKEKALLKKVRQELYELEESQRKADFRLLGEYLAKYNNQFWD